MLKCLTYFWRLYSLFFSTRLKAILTQLFASVLLNLAKVASKIVFDLILRDKVFFKLRETDFQTVQPYKLIQTINIFYNQKGFWFYWGAFFYKVFFVLQCKLQ